MAICIDGTPFPTPIDWPQGMTTPLWNPWISAAKDHYIHRGMDEEAAHAAALSLWYDCGHVTAITPEQAVDQDLAEAGDIEK